MRLSDFKAEPATHTFEFKGKTVTLTELSAKQTALVRSAFPRPVPPLGIKRVQGNFVLNPEPEPNDLDPAYQQQNREWMGRVTVVECAVAMGYHTADGKGAPTDEATFPAWANAAYTELTTLTDRELGTLVDGYNTLGRENARSFSSAPQGAGQTQTPSLTTTG